MSEAVKGILKEQQIRADEAREHLEMQRKQNEERWEKHLERLHAMEPRTGTNAVRLEEERTRNFRRQQEEMKKGIKQQRKIQEAGLKEFKENLQELKKLGGNTALREFEQEVQKTRSEKRRAELLAMKPR
jgi:hypothetical protein